MTTRDEILQFGEALMRKQGFNAFSYYHLADALKMRPAAIHYHFPTKEALALGIVNAARKNYKDFMSESSLEPDLQERLRLFIRTFYIHASEKKICMVGATGADYYSFTPETQEAIREMVNEITQWLTALLREGKATGVFTFKGTPRTRALLISTNMAASLHIARIAGQKEFEQIARQLLDDICVPVKSPEKTKSKRKRK